MFKNNQTRMPLSYLFHLRKISALLKAMRHECKLFCDGKLQYPGNRAELLLVELDVQCDRDLLATAVFILV